jgi:hypothetical protein
VPSAKTLCADDYDENHDQQDPSSVSPDTQNYETS